jgi:SAM-dependent methyltransferase
MPAHGLLRRLLVHPLARGLDLESAAATAVHARLIREKPLLNRLYRRYYAEFEEASGRAAAGARLEIGSGGGFLGELIPGLISVDLRPGADVDLAASALELPLADGRIGAIFMLNVLHHLPDPARFFDEAIRVLAPGGRLVAIEPYVSPLARVLYGKLHHEAFEPERQEWEVPVDGPLAGANGALPWIVFERDRAEFERRFPALEIARVDPHTVAAYLLSGGVSLRALLPGAAAGPLFALEERLGPLYDRLATMMTVELRRR